MARYLPIEEHGLIGVRAVAAALARGDSRQLGGE
jgi:hypothetical protein